MGNLVWCELCLKKMPDITGKVVEPVRVEYSISDEEFEIYEVEDVCWECREKIVGCIQKLVNTDGDLVAQVKQLRHELQTYADTAVGHPPTWSLGTLKKIEEMLGIEVSQEGE